MMKFADRLRRVLRRAVPVVADHAAPAETRLGEIAGIAPASTSDFRSRVVANIRRAFTSEDAKERAAELSSRSANPSSRASESLLPFPKG